jgi:hypothetical protein
MAFQKGHPNYPPKDGRQPGATKAHAQAQRHIALAVRESIAPQAMVDFHLAIACGHAAMLYKHPPTGEISAVCMCCPASEGGHPKGPSSGVLKPTQEERTRSVNWLADRGHGLPAQSVYVDNVVRGGKATGPDLGALPASALFGVLKLLRTAAPSDDARALPAPIEVHAVEHAVEYAHELASDDGDPRNQVDDGDE